MLRSNRHLAELVEDERRPFFVRPRRPVTDPTEEDINRITREMVPRIEKDYVSLLTSAEHDTASQAMPSWKALLAEMLQAVRDGKNSTPRESVAWCGNVKHRLCYRSQSLDHVLAVLQFIRLKCLDRFKMIKYHNAFTHSPNKHSKELEADVNTAEQANLRSAAVKEILVSLPFTLTALQAHLTLLYPSLHAHQVLYPWQAVMRAITIMDDGVSGENIAPSQDLQPSADLACKLTCFCLSMLFLCAGLRGNSTLCQKGCVHNPHRL